MAQAGAEGFLHIEQQGSGSHQARLIVVEAEAGQGVDAEVPKQPGASGLGIEGPAGPVGEGHAARRLAKTLVQDGRATLRNEALGGAEPAQLIRQVRPGDIGRLEFPGGQLHPGHSDPFPLRPEGRQVIGAARIEQVVLS